MSDFRMTVYNDEACPECLGVMLISFDGLITITWCECCDYESVVGEGNLIPIQVSENAKSRRCKK